MNKIYEVSNEFLNTNGDVEDFVILDGFNTYEEALSYAEKQPIIDSDTQLSIYESDENGNVLDSWIIK